MIDLDEVAKRLDRRDGFRVVAYREVGLPLFRMSCALTLQEISELGAIEEYMLRSISLGVNTVNDVERFLGLPYRVVVAQLGQLVTDELVRQVSAEPHRYRITPARASFRGCVNLIVGATSCAVVCRRHYPSASVGRDPRAVD